MNRRTLVAAWLTAAACSNGGAGTGTADAATAVQVVDAAEESFPVTIGATGTVTVRPGGVSELASPGASRVKSIGVGIGDRVTPGQVLITLDPSVWEAQLAEAQAAVSAAKQASERANRLAEQGILPRKDAEQAAAELARAQSALASSTLVRSMAELKSPIDGVVDSLDASLDELVAEGSILVRVVDPRAIEVVFRLSPADAGRVRAGMPVSIGPRSDSASANAMGRVVAVAPSIDATSGAVPVRVRITQAGRPLRIGEIVDGRIEVDRHEHAVVVPLEALVDVSGSDATVYTAGDDGIAHARPIRIGARDASRVEILDGVAAGERVITHGAYALRDSVRVTVEAGS
jgi:RND family efflux transporter MFP subunit